MNLGHRIRWARQTAKLSHDTLVKEIGRSNRGHLIKVEKGEHTPRVDLRNAIADATNVPRELFEDDLDEEDHLLALDLLQVIRRINAAKRNEPSGSREEASLGSSSQGE